MELSKKSEYPTFARTTTLDQDVIYMIMALLRKFNWHKFAIMYEKSHIWNSVFKAFQKEVEADKNSDLKITFEESYVKTDSYTFAKDSLEHKFGPFLEAVRKKARSMTAFLSRA